MKVLAVRDVFVDTRPQISSEDMLWVVIDMKWALRDHVRLSSRPRILLTVGTPEKESPVPTSSASLLPGLNSNPRLQTLCIWYRSAEETEIVNTRRQAMNPRSLDHGRSACVPWKEWRRQLVKTHSFVAVDSCILSRRNESSGREEPDNHPNPELLANHRAISEKRRERRGKDDGADEDWCQATWYIFIFKIVR